MCPGLYCHPVFVTEHQFGAQHGYPEPKKHCPLCPDQFGVPPYCFNLFDPCSQTGFALCNPLQKSDLFTRVSHG
jgi:hypothetical protein